MITRASGSTRAAVGAVGVAAVIGLLDPQAAVASPTAAIQVAGLLSSRDIPRIIKGERCEVGGNTKVRGER